MLDYPVIILDCDGVILDSNSLKSDAMGEAVAKYGAQAAATFVDYHRQHGGISRYEKFEYFLREIAEAWSVPAYEELLERFSSILKAKLIDVPYTSGAREFLQSLSASAEIYIVSGGDQEELRWTFSERGDTGFFEEIYGSPVTKDQHCKHIIQTLAEGTRVLFIGDSRLDHEAAAANHCDFIFLSGYTEFDQWQDYCQQHGLIHYADFSTLTAQHQ